MADNYTNVSITGYNANPPSDDGTAAAQNEVEWAKHKDKLGDPLKTAIEALDTNIDAAITALEAFLGPGLMVPYAGLTAPTGWTLCDGSSKNSVSDTTFAALFTIIGTTFGGTGASDFNVPDMRGRVAAGQDDMGGTSANRLTGQTGGVDGDVFAATGGAETHVLTEAQMASQAHSLLAANAAVQTGGTNALGVAQGSAVQGVQSGGSFNVYAFNAFGVLGATGTTESAGSDEAHNNLQPTMILNWIIKK